MSLAFDDIDISGLITGEGLLFRKPVIAATVADAPIATSYENGDTLDGIALVTGDRILLKNQASAIENGIYIVEVAGAPTRSQDMQVGDSAASLQIPILRGTVNGATVYICTEDVGADVVGTNNLGYSISTIGGGTLPVGQGGTGSTTLTANRFLVGNGGGAVDLSKVVPTGVVIGTTDTQTMTNKTLNIPTITDVAGVHTVYAQATNNLNFNVADQTVGLSTLNVPNLASTTDTMAMVALAQTLTNKTLAFPDITTDGAKHLTLNTAGNDLLLLSAVQTIGDATITIPNLASVSDVLVLQTLAQTLANKTLVSDTTVFQDATVPAKQLSLDLTTLTVARILTAPDESGIIATQTYVDSVAQGLVVKDAVRVASTINVNIAAAPAAIDGIALVANDRVLLKDQAAGQFNGIYVWASIGGAMVRSADYDDVAKIVPGSFMFVQEGTVNEDSGWVLTTDNPIVVDTTVLTFTQFSGAGQIIAGNGLSKTGNTLDVNLQANGGLVFNGDNLELDLSATTINGTLAVGDGGTGQTALTANRFLVGNGAAAVDLAKVVPTGVVIGTTDTQTMTNKTLTSPVINEILDANGNELTIFATAAAAVNELTIGNAAAGNAPQLSATGTDANINMAFSSKGTGAYSFQGTGTTSAALEFYEQTTNGVNKITLQAPAALAADVTFTLPGVDGATGNHIITDGAGVLSFEQPPLDRIAYAINGHTALANNGFSVITSSRWIWDHSRYNGVYLTGSFTFHCETFSRDAEIQLWDLTNTVQLALQAVPITTVQAYTIPFTLPASDAIIIMRIRRVTGGGGGANRPRVTGGTLEFTTIP